GQRMTQQDYLKQVEAALGNTDEATRGEILEDLTQHFLIGLKQGKTEEEIITSLGDVSQFENLDDFPQAKKEEKPVDQKTDEMIEGTQRSIFVDAGYADIHVVHSKDNAHHVYLIKDGVTMENSYLLEKKVENSELRIRMTTSNRFFHVFDRDLQIRLEVASAAMNLNIGTASGDIELKDLTLDELLLSTASGDMQLSALNARNLRLHSAAGDMVLKTVAGSINIDTASGDVDVDQHRGDSFTMKSANGDLNYRGSVKEMRLHGASSDGVLNLDQVERLMIETVSGDYRIHLAAQVSGVKLDFKGISGTCEYAVLGQTGKLDGRLGKTTLGDGKVDIDLRCISGDFSIEN
ncbi:MAG: DUF1700 domain-containing protein, partial [Erysipelotrichales bacterium]